MSTAVAPSPVASEPIRRSATAVLLIETGERLFAEQGLDAVSLRQIAVAAGQHNKFAVQYHFGDKRTLLKAIMDYRLPRIDALRRSLLEGLLARDPSPDVRALLEVLIQPLAVEAVQPDSRYVSFLSRARFHELSGARWWDGDPHGFISPLGIHVSELVIERLRHLPKELRVCRFRLLVGHCLQALASYESSADSETTAAKGEFRLHDLPFVVFVMDLLDTTASGMAAPFTAVAAAALSPASKR